MPLRATCRAGYLLYGVDVHVACAHLLPGLIAGFVIGSYVDDDEKPL